MGLFSEIRCPRCGRRYSSVRTRCPHCGARRSSKGRRSSSDENSTIKLIIGALLMLILIVAVVTLLIMTFNGKGNTQDGSANSDGSNTGGDAITSGDDSNTPVGTGDDSNVGDSANNPDGSADGSNSGDGTGTTPDDSTGDGDNSDGGTNPPEPAGLNSLKMTFLGQELNAYGNDNYNYDVTMSVGDTLSLGCETDPADAAEGASWSSSDSGIASVLSSGEVTGVASGTAVITLTVDSQSVTCYVRVR